MARTKICNFKSSGLGGYSFIFVSIRKETYPKPNFKYFFCADVVCVQDDGIFVSGAVLTYSPHATLKDAMRRWKDLGPAFIESNEGLGIEELAKLAIKKNAHQ